MYDVGPDALSAVFRLAVSHAPGLHVEPAAWVFRHSARDDANAAIVVEHSHDIEDLLLVSRNARGWLRYWSVKHPNPETRAACERALADPMAKENARRAREHLRRHGVEVLDV
jgi:hypothetical protein